ncbi:MAG: ABC transporter permease [Chloroflexota bacterium]
MNWMAGYLAKRLFSGLLSFLLFTAVLFLAINLLIPGDYVGTLAAFMAPEEMAALRAEFGLDQPLWRQYLTWLGHLLRGDLGQSFTGVVTRAPVTELLQSALPATLLVFILGAALAFGLGLQLSQIAARPSGRRLSGGITLASVILYTTFPPWLTFLLAYFLVDRFKIIPGLTSIQFSRNLWLDAPLEPAAVMLRMVLVLAAVLVTIYLLNWLWRRWRRRNLPSLLGWLLFPAATIGVWYGGGYLPLAANILQVALIPLTAFILLSFGDTALLMRASMLDVQHETYILLAQAKGLSPRAVRGRHVARNAFLPVLTRFVINLPYLLTGVVIVERATHWSGIGDLLFRAVENQDTYVYMAIMVIVGLVTLAARLLLELLYVYLDPRLRFGEATIQ